MSTEHLYDPVGDVIAHGISRELPVRLTVLERLEIADLKAVAEDELVTHQNRMADAKRELAKQGEAIARRIGVEPIVVAKPPAIGDRDGGLMYRLSTRGGAFALAQHEALAVDWVSLAIRDAGPDLAADVRVSGPTWLATQYGVDREVLVNLVIGTLRLLPRVDRRGCGVVDLVDHHGVGGQASIATATRLCAAAAVRTAGGCAVPGAAVTVGRNAWPTHSPRRLHRSELTRSRRRSTAPRAGRSGLASSSPATTSTGATPGPRLWCRSPRSGTFWAFMELFVR